MGLANTFLCTGFPRLWLHGYIHDHTTVPLAESETQLDQLSGKTMHGDQPTRKGTTDPKNNDENVAVRLVPEFGFQSQVCSDSLWGVCARSRPCRISVQFPVPPTWGILSKAGFSLDSQSFGNLTCPLFFERGSRVAGGEGQTRKVCTSRLMVHR